MIVKVRLYTILKKYGEGKIGDDNSVVVSENENLGELSSQLNIPEHISKMYLVNGAPRKEKYILCKGDEVKIFSFIGGG